MEWYDVLVAFVSLIIPTSADGRISLQHRDARAPSNACKWGLWGGSSVDGESAEECARREFFEETGIGLEGVELRLVARANREGRHLYFFAFKFAGVLPIVALGEGDGFGEFRLDALDSIECDDNVDFIRSRFGHISWN